MNRVDDMPADHARLLDVLVAAAVDACETDGLTLTEAATVCAMACGAVLGAISDVEKRLFVAAEIAKRLPEGVEKNATQHETPEKLQ